MRTSIEKILKKFVFGDVDISYYEINSYPSPLMNLKNYEVEIYTSLDIDMVDAERMLERLETAFKMLGFGAVSGNMFNDVNKDKLLIRVTGFIRTEGDN